MYLTLCLPGSEYACAGARQVRVGDPWGSLFPNPPPAAVLAQLQVGLRVGDGVDSVETQMLLVRASPFWGAGRYEPTHHCTQMSFFLAFP